MIADNESELTILGGGITGLSAAYHASLKGVSATVYEAKKKPGGLTANFEIDGFRFDNAIHMSFTKNEYVRSLFDKTPYFTHSPDAYCIEKDNWMKHPVQNNLYPLALSEKIELLESFVNRPNYEPVNYGEWLHTQYGKAISERFPAKYTKKYWCLEPEDLSLNWIGNRMRRAEFSEVLSGAMSEKNENHFYAGEMRYPKQGGYYRFIERLIHEANVQCGKRVSKVDPENKIVAFDDGSSREYSNLISTLPLPMLCRFLINCPAEVIDASQSLLWTTVDLVSIGFSKDKVPPYLWFYLYDSDFLASRAYSPSEKSRDNAPTGCSSLQFEIYNLSTSERMDAELMKDNVLKFLIDMKICEKEDIVLIHHKHLPFGNVVFDHGMEDRREVVRRYLKEIGIVSCGRFGEWDYLWSDQSLISGKNAFESLGL